MRALALLLLVVQTHACSFIVASQNLTARYTRSQLEHANYFNRWRGPDATHVHTTHIGEPWSFVHNLLSMTGAFTLQPFSSPNGKVVALFNGEIYNYRALGAELKGDENAFASDGEVLVPAYQRWGRHFVRHLEGEFAIVVVDFQRRSILLSTDAFSTKPLWYASWRDASGRAQFMAASYESVLTRLNVPSKSHEMAAANEAIVLRMDTHELVHRFPLVKWDLNQHKEDTSDWANAFREAVRTRTSRLKHRVFIGLSNGYDSGVIALALKQLNVPFLGYTVTSKEDMEVIHARRRALASIAETSSISLSESKFEAERAFLEKRCEPYHYVVHDRGAIGLSSVLHRATPRGGLVYLSGTGGDELYSDYTVNGFRVGPDGKASCFGGVWPANLSAPGADGKPFFPWCNFYYGSQRQFLMKEELTAGAHGAEGRYPLLDPKVVQEFLWLKHTVKNAEYKKPLADMLRDAQFPNLWGEKKGFNVEPHYSFLSKRFGCHAKGLCALVGRPLRGETVVAAYLLAVSALLLAVAGRTCWRRARGYAALRAG